MSTNWKNQYIRSRYLVQKTIREYNEKPALKAYVEIFLTLIAISLFGLFAIRPTLITIGQLLQEIDAKEATIAIMNEKINNLRIAEDLYRRESEKIKLVKEAIPEHPSPDNLILQIEEMARMSSININNLTVENTKIIGEIPSNDDGELTLTLYISGKYQNLLKFASGIENLRRPVKYNGLSISQIGSIENQELSMSFKDPSTPYVVRK